jgi:hypothetical protein
MVPFELFMMIGRFVDLTTLAKLRLLKKSMYKSFDKMTRQRHLQKISKQYNIQFPQCVFALSNIELTVLVRILNEMRTGPHKIHLINSFRRDPKALFGVDRQTRFHITTVRILLFVNVNISLIEQVMFGCTIDNKKIDSGTGTSDCFYINRVVFTTLHECDTMQQCGENISVVTYEIF